MQLRSLVDVEWRKWDEPWSCHKAGSYYHAYGYGYRLLLVLFLLYVIQSYNDYCYYYMSVRSLRTIFIPVITFYALKYYKHLCSSRNVCKCAIVYKWAYVMNYAWSNWKILQESRSSFVISSFPHFLPYMLISYLNLFWINFK